MENGKNYDKCCSTCARLVKDNDGCDCEKKKNLKRIINHPNMSLCSWYSWYRRDYDGINTD